MSCKQPFEKMLVSLIDGIAEFPQVDNSSSKTPRVKQPDTPLGRDASLDELRLYVKYLLFDLDATRRENVYLRKLLEKRE